jgi:hypothetical protein
LPEVSAGVLHADEYELGARERGGAGEIAAQLVRRHASCPWFEGRTAPSVAMAALGLPRWVGGAPG